MGTLSNLIFWDNVNALSLLNLKFEMSGINGPFTFWNLLVTDFPFEYKQKKTQQNNNSFSIEKTD